jgi:hypothetical protein
MGAIVSRPNLRHEVACGSQDRWVLPGANLRLDDGPPSPAFSGHGGAGGGRWGRPAPRRFRLISQRGQPHHTAEPARKRRGRRGYNCRGAPDSRPVEGKQDTRGAGGTIAPAPTWHLPQMREFGGSVRRRVPFAGQVAPPENAAWLLRSDSGTPAAQLRRTSRSAQAQIKHPFCQIDRPAEPLAVGARAHRLTPAEASALAAAHGGRSALELRPSLCRDRCGKTLP